jgi:hypothetical protein
MKPLIALVCLLAVGAAAPSPIEDALLGFRLAEAARRAGDADLMLSAARLVAGSGLRGAILRNGRLEAGEGLPDTSEEALVLAEEARLLAPDDRRIADAVDRLRSARPKGIIGGSWGSGPLEFREMLAPGGSIAWTVEARGAETALVSAIGDGDAGLRLRVEDARGRSVCDQRGESHYPLCRWSPPRPGRYRVSLGNAGRVPTRVMVLSN